MDAHPAGMVVMSRVTGPPYMWGNMILIVFCPPACNDAAGAGSILSGHDASASVFGGHAKSHCTSYALNALKGKRLPNEKSKQQSVTVSHQCTTIVGVLEHVRIDQFSPLPHLESGYCSRQSIIGYRWNLTVEGSAICSTQVHLCAASQSDQRLLTRCDQLTVQVNTNCTVGTSNHRSMEPTTSAYTITIISFITIHMKTMNV